MPRHVFVDGRDRLDVACDCDAVIGGDGLVVSIAAASIVAKVTRDRLMCALAQDCPGYGFESHKGYSVPEHLAALDRLGPSAHHRRFFAPVVAGEGKNISRGRSNAILICLRKRRPALKSPRRFDEALILAWVRPGPCSGAASSRQPACVSSRNAMVASLAGALYHLWSMIRKSGNRFLKR